MIAETVAPAGTRVLAADLLPRPHKDRINGAVNSYQVMNQLGKGGCGYVMQCRRVSDGMLMAVKMEPATTKYPVLIQEIVASIQLTFVESRHILKYYDHGSVQGRFRFLITDVAGCNLYDLRMKMQDKRFSLTTSLRLAEQALAGLRDFHKIGYLHRDVKPPNFVVGPVGNPTQHTVFLIDFGLCRRFRSLEKVHHRPRERVAFRGTTRYASLASLDLKEQSRKDDLESWWYMVVEWTVGRLPWKSADKHQRVLLLNHKIIIRQEAQLQKMLQGSPNENYAAILRYLDSLTYGACPDYDYVSRQIKAAQKLFNCDLMAPAEWENSKACWKGPTYEEGHDVGLICYQALAVHPPACSIEAAGGTSKHKLINQCDKRIAFKVFAVQKLNYTVSVVAGFVGVGETLEITINRNKGKPSGEKLVFLFADVTDADKDPNHPFRDYSITKKIYGEKTSNHVKK